MKIKNKILTLGLLILTAFAYITNAFAIAYPPENTGFPNEDDMVEFKIHINVPDNYFKERVEVYLDYTPFTLSYMENADNNGYDMKTWILPGTYKVNVMSSTDIDECYAYEAPETFNPETDKTLNINIVLTDAYYDLMDDSDAGDDYDNEEIPEPEYLEAEVFDYSEGGEYGTIHLDFRQYACIDEVVYTLVGGGHMYEIPLNVDNLFVADVLLPPGSYYESSLSGIVLDKEAYAPDDMTFLFAHEDNMSFWGNYYQVEADGEIDITDVIILMEYQGNTEEVDSNKLFSATVVENRSNARQTHIEEKMEEFFPELYEEPETFPDIPIAESEETTSSHSYGVIIIIAVIAALACILGSIVYIRHRRE